MHYQYNAIMGKRDFFSYCNVHHLKLHTWLVFLRGTCFANTLQNVIVEDDFVDDDGFDGDDNEDK